MECYRIIIENPYNHVSLKELLQRSKKLLLRSSLKKNSPVMMKKKNLGGEHLKTMMMELTQIKKKGTKTTTMSKNTKSIILSKETRKRNNQ